MRRDDRQPFDIEADEAADITQQFWGSTRGWGQPVDEDRDDWADHTPRSIQAITSTLLGVRPRRPQSSGRRTTGRIDRTRSHGIPRPASVADQPMSQREATLGELAAGWIDDDEWPELDFATTRLPKVEPAAQPPAPPQPPRQSQRRHQQPRRRRPEVEQFPEDAIDDEYRDFDEFDGGPYDDSYDEVPLSPVAPLASRLGLGAVDPLLARLGAIAIAGVMLVPIALAARGGDTTPAIAGEVVMLPAPNAQQAAAPAAGGAVTATQAVQTPVTQPATPAASDGSEGADSAVAADGADDEAPAEGVQAFAAQSTEATDAADAADDEPAADATESAQSTPDAVVEAATVTEPAVRLEPDCSLSYEAGLGDSWYRIADAAGVTPKALIDQNLASLDTPIFPGDEICLPAGATIPQQPVSTTAPASTAPPTTAAAPTTTAAPPPSTTSPPPAPVSTSGVQALIREIWPDELEEKALQIAYRESNYRANAYNGHCCYGVFQIHWTAHRSWLDDYGINTSSDLFDARKNITAAYALYQRAGGWGPWGG